MMKRLTIVVMAVILLVSCAKETEKIRLGLIRPSMNHLPVLYGLENGIIDSTAVELHYFSSGWETNEALVNGKLDAAIMPFTYAWTDVSRGLPVRVLSFLERESDGIVTGRNHPDLASLKDARIGVLRASTLDIFARMLSEQEQLGWSLVPFRSPIEMAAALQSGEVDALSFYVPPIFKLGEDFHIVAWYSDYFPEHPCCDLAIHTAALDTKKQALRELKAGILHSIRQMDEDSTHLAEFAGRYFDVELPYLQGSLDHTCYDCDLEDAGKHFEKIAADAMQHSGYLERTVEPDEVYVNLGE